jgi:hypothetical protein
VANLCVKNNRHPFTKYISKNPLNGISQNIVIFFKKDFILAASGKKSRSSNCTGTSATAILNNIQRDYVLEKDGLSRDNFIVDISQ